MLRSSQNVNKYRIEQIGKTLESPVLSRVFCTEGTEAFIWKIRLPNVFVVLHMNNSIEAAYAID